MNLCTQTSYGMTSVSCIFPVFKSPVDKTLNPITPGLIIKYVCLMFEIEENDIRGTCRIRKFVDGRKMAIYLIKKYLPFYSYKRIGEMFGGRDHSTIIFSCNSLEDLIQTDFDMKRIYIELCTKLDGFVKG